MKCVREATNRSSYLRLSAHIKNSCSHLSRPSFVECLVSKETTTYPDKGRGAYCPKSSQLGVVGSSCCQMAFTSIGSVLWSDCLKHPEDLISWPVQFTSDSSQRQTVLIKIGETIQRLHPQFTYFLWLQVMIMITMTSNLKLKSGTVYLTLAMAQTFEKTPRHTEGEWI